MSERSMLMEHGTQLMTLAPKAVLDAAIEDIKRFNRNRDPERDRGPGEYEHYAFHRMHVRQAAGDPLKLLKLAFEEPGLGAASAKYYTRLLYSDTELLMAAFAARAKEAV